MAYGVAKGPLKLGHLLPGPRAVDNIINTGGVLPFPMDMRITKSNTLNLRYARRAEQMNEANAAIGAPLAQAAGLTAGVDAGTLFRQLMGDTWNIERLETQIVQPTFAYVEMCRTTPELASWVDRHKKLGAWTVYIVTGLMIARGAKNERTEEREREMHAGADIDVANAARSKANARHTYNEGTEVSGEHLDDFVWAIRLSRVSRGHFSNALEVEPHTDGAVLAPSDEKIDVNAILAGEGLLDDDLHTLHMLTVNSDGSEELIFVTIDRR
ncbi:hypothetical protein QIS74_12043 [Colletotrichum tabaci]|uniref:Uncharacterized protein n=1 Tax=Colletotrichum tabaci TaxID=1209068 RepID=A0AAV9SY98_9PEZI